MLHKLLKFLNVSDGSVNDDALKSLVVRLAIDWLRRVPIIGLGPLSLLVTVIHVYQNEVHSQLGLRKRAESADLNGRICPGLQRTYDNDIL